MNRKLRMGMVGGGRGAFIGAVHRMAATMDGKIELVAGAFSSDPATSRLSGQDLFLDSARVYDDYQQMAQREAALDAARRIDFVSIVVRNDLHYDVAKSFLEAGFHVVCDKPMTFTYEQALDLRARVRKSGLLFCLTHNYCGYPMVKEARRMVLEGELGRVLKIIAEYSQGYAVGDVDRPGSGQLANWRADPAVAGISNCIGDIGTHAHHLARYVTGLEVEHMCCELTSFIPGRELDDDGMCLIRFHGGAKGILVASQISNGDENALSLRVYGTKAGLEWHQEDPNELIVKCANAPRRTFRRGNDYLSDVAKRNTRIPFGHPEAYVEAFANVYLAAAEAIRNQIAGRQPPATGYDFPNEDDGVAGMAFIKTAVESSRSNSKWMPFPATP